ncbi:MULTISPECIES: DUF4214 domain-containing protein [Marivita]|uniref:DUF4214 domain-containing protein n=1 Tax=Marivita cryptomonadis TaxID=505252 RepID=A0A9Q2P6Z0_9RHOB|nr:MULTISPECIES: DUF4214 domain-containing protein [Marivita]MCR9169468.1 DUF4214 domain-containing protein [Paracoccaceae bacterium]MBM2320142.1 DUF4214 domain-containing protein [Marivita cryptomonadis]MBM2329721.1 DUF4214 domain-containing protein [Marivita cryptomonadis]MBM2339309.1 DUF4214 domain-containing protein [Marivita cryptomonadis]MBM2343967.1 DUF4214 domain-containing protein [Marivita cryptomonadis]
MEPLTDVFGTQTSAAGLSFGLRGVVDWSVQQPFLDVFKTARPWLGHSENQWGAYGSEDLGAMGLLDANGWITDLPSGVDRVETFILTEMPVEAQYTAGSYRLSYDGAGEIHVHGADIISQANGEIWFNYTPTGEGMVTISITGTDPQNTGNYLRNIEVVKQEYIPAFEAGALFNPLWLDMINDAQGLRFMDWQETNNSQVQSWSDRPTVGTYSYAEGVPLEVMVALANATGTEPWFNMPWNADEAYIRNFATYVRDNLDPDLRAHIEMSNEVWNWMFEQAREASADAQERFGQDLGDGWMQEYGARAAEMASVLDSVYAGSEDQLVKVIATHTGWPGLEESILQAPNWQALSPANAAPYLSFDTYAITGYFSGGLGTDAKAPLVLNWIAQSEAQARQDAASLGLSGSAANAYFAEHRFDQAVALAVRELRDGSVTGDAEDSLVSLFELFAYHKSVADAHGLDLVMYEGGTHVAGSGQWINNDLLTEFFTHLNYSDGMGQLYTELLAGWEAAGGTLFNAFVDVSEPSQWGSWGSLRHLQDSTARHDAVVEFMESHPAPATMKDGIVGNATFDFGPVPEPTPQDEDDTPVVTPQPRPEPQPQPTPEPTPEQPRPTRQPDIAPTAEVREYVFGTGLFALADGNPEHSVAHWMEQMAGSSGTSYATSIQTGMLTLHDNLPPNPHLWIEGVASSWAPESGQSFADANINQITISEENFTQDQAPDAPDYADPSSSPAEAALRIIAWVEGQAPGATINLYETWPSLEPFADSFPPSAEAFGNWVSYLTGDWHGWWVALHEIIRDARPDLDVRLISAGPQIAQMLGDLGIAEFTAQDLFQDLEGHGTPTLYFLAATIHYTTLYGTPPSTDIQLPNTLHPAVVNNFAQIVEWVADNLATLPSPMVAPFSERSDGGASAPVQTGTAGDDIIQPDSLIGAIDGGTGFDTLLLDGNQTFYSLRIGDDDVWLENRVLDSAPVQIRNIERLQFDSHSSSFGEAGIDLDLFDGMARLTDDAMGTLTELYIAYFNRAPDAVGLFFWGNQLADGMSLREIAGYFFDQPETRALYGDVADLSEFVSTVYQNVLGRAPDASGLEFWLDLLESNAAVTPSTFIMEILAGAKAATGSAADAAYLENKVALGSHFAITRGMSDVEEASMVMSEFDGSQISLEEGLARSDDFYEEALSATDGDFLIQLVGVSDAPFAI